MRNGDGGNGQSVFCEPVPRKKEKKMGKDEYRFETKHGYPLDEVASALQKSIRRGQEREACFWAYILIDDGKWRYMWRRLAVMASEDIGNADPMAAVMVHSLAELSKLSTNNWASGKRPEGVHEMQAVQYLARAKKNRSADDAVVVMGRRIKDGERLEVPEHAIDGHTARGRSNGIKKMEHFRVEGRRLANVSGDNPYEEEAWGGTCTVEQAE